MNPKTNLVPIVLSLLVLGGGAFAVAKYGGKAPVKTGAAVIDTQKNEYKNPLSLGTIAGTTTDKTACAPLTGATFAIPGYRPADYACGSATANVVIVEYSDLECPFCKQFHASMRTVMDGYKTQSVAWVYRHFPLDNLHSRARHEAEATECAGKLAGPVGFWNYVNKVFDVTSANNSLSPEFLPLIASELGLDREAFTTCLASGEFKEKIATDQALGVTAGAKGTPYSVIYVNGTQFDVVPGAVDGTTVKAKIDLALASLK